MNLKEVQLENWETFIISTMLRMRYIDGNDWI